MYTNRVGLKFNVCSAALAGAKALAGAADGDGREQNLGKARPSSQVKTTARFQKSCQPT